MALIFLNIFLADISTEQTGSSYPKVWEWEVREFEKNVFKRGFKIIQKIVFLIFWMPLR